MQGGALATGISVPFIAGEQASKDALRPVLEKAGLKPFGEKTEKNLILTSLSQGLSSDFEFTPIPAGAFYAGSPVITVNSPKGEGIDINDPAVEQLRSNCLKALDEAGGFESVVKKWCAEITIKEILKRKGLKTLYTEEQAKNSLIHRLIFSIENFSIEANSFYDSSSEISVTIDSVKKKYEEAQLSHPKKELKEQCLQALQSKEVGDKQKYLKNAHTWCLQLSVKDVLIRNGFEPLNNDTEDEIWKKVIAGGWFKEGAFFIQKTLSSEKTLFNITGSNAMDGQGGINNVNNVENKHISALKRECSKLLNKSFVREKFPKTNDSSDGGLPSFDPFQEASWFCVKPITTEDYVKNTLKKTIDENNRDSCKNNLEWKTFNVNESSLQFTDFWETINSIVSTSSDRQVSCIKK